jgi:hypothetical protein
MESQTQFAQHNLLNERCGVRFLRTHLACVLPVKLTAEPPRPMFSSEAAKEIAEV